MTIQILNLPTGEQSVTMSMDEYEDLIDARDHAIALRGVSSGNMPLLSDDDMETYLAAPTPLAFWRRHRGLTQAHLAVAVEVSQPHIAQIESGQKEASAAIYARLARHLGVRIDDLIPE